MLLVLLNTLGNIFICSRTMRVSILRAPVGCSQDGCPGRGGSNGIMACILTRSIWVY
jgi:hypothetical protein